MQRALVPARAVHAAALAALLLVPVVVVASYAPVWTGQPEPADLAYFGPAGAAILRGAWSEVFRDPAVQAGPLELLPFGVLELVGPSTGAGWVVAHAVGNLALVLGYLVAVLAPLARGPLRRRAARSGATSPSRMRPLVYVGAAAGALVVLGEDLPWAVSSGHPAQVAVPALWVVAAHAARRGHSTTTGVLVALSAAWEPWGVLGAPVIFCAARPDLVRAACAGAVTVALTYGPFVATGSFRMFELAWPVTGMSAVHAVLPDLEEFPWSLRLLQAVVVLGVGVAVARLGRRSVYAAWLVPLAVLTTRLLLDPVMWQYYWIAPQVVLVALAAFAVASRHRAAAVVSVGAALVVESPGARTLPGLAVLLVLTVLCAVLLHVRAPAPREEHDRVPVPREEHVPVP
ncbi:hypothetical protein [Cellulomonas sp. NS3]|uniref:hypothetical protein n=1 Tax=Cellulomonas sp. NS3 TaxID=2973977 RepID=UPI002163A6AF|nr:hypothetical protein [Cellulomonas sp. NS3]